MTQTRYYKKKLTATNTQQSVTLPRLVQFTILNAGNFNVFVEPDNDIDADSVLLPAGMSLTLGPDSLNLQYKSENAEETAVLYISGQKHEKS